MQVIKKRCHYGLYPKHMINRHEKRAMTSSTQVKHFKRKRWIFFHENKPIHFIRLSKVNIIIAVRTVSEAAQ